MVHDHQGGHRGCRDGYKALPLRNQETCRRKDFIKFIKCVCVCVCVCLCVQMALGEEFGLRETLLEDAVFEAIKG